MMLAIPAVMETMIPPLVTDSSADELANGGRACLIVRTVTCRLSVQR